MEECNIIFKIDNANININRYTLQYKYFGESLYLYTFNDFFIFEANAFYTEEDLIEVFNYFKFHVLFINEITKSINEFLNINLIIKDLSKILSTSSIFLLFELQLRFFRKYHIPIVSIDNIKSVNRVNSILSSVSITMKWNFCNLYTLIFRKEAIPLNGKVEYTEIANNDLRAYDKYGNIKWVHDINKERDNLIKFLSILFNLSRKEMKYWN